MKGCYYKKGEERKALLTETNFCPNLEEWELIKEVETTNKLMCTEHSE